jgi:iron complex outermembrane receptor protein
MALEEVITTGTRISGRTAIQSLVPVDVISSESIENSGAVNTMDMLRRLAPSFNVNNTTTSDGQDLNRPATLRSMAPDQVLVLINGKRRHQMAMIAVQENVGRGSAGTDLNAIPLTAIQRVEILRDGAAAQYGSDAIAGVINIILKADEGGSAWASYRETDEGDGETLKVGLHWGTEIGNGGNFNLTYEYHDADQMNRATKTDWFGASPVTTELLLVGEADTESDSFWINSMLPVGGGELYFFGGYSKFEGESLGFFRGPNDGRVWSELFPGGVTPALGTETEDSSLAIGYRFDVGNWENDVSLAWGENEFSFSNVESLNASYGPSSPTKADDGSLSTDQITFNFDTIRSFEVSWAEGTILALGMEYREDGFEQKSGDVVSYARGPVLCDENFVNSSDPNKDPSSCVYTTPDGEVNGTTVPGMQGFQGYSPAMELDEDRDVFALYGEYDMRLTERLDIDLAVRWEDYSDFGDTTNGKIAGRFAFTDAFAMRASVSTGFRAPGVQQKHFTQRSISLDNGVLADLVTLRPDTDIASDFGFDELEEETSISYSIGFTYSGEIWTSTLDVYRIDIDDRIVISDNVSYGSSAEIDAIYDMYNQSGGLLDGVANVNIFTNAIDTETTGLDWVNIWDFRMGAGDLQLEATLHLNDTDIEEIRSSSSLVPGDALYGDSAQLLLTDGQPGERGVLAATYTRNSWSITGRANYFGEVETASYGTLPNEWGDKTLFDITGYWNIGNHFQISGGVLNVTDEYPDKWGDEGAPFPDLGFKYGWTTFPYSIAGREYYVRLAYNF